MNSGHCLRKARIPGCIPCAPAFLPRRRRLPFPRTAGRRTGAARALPSSAFPASSRGRASAASGANGLRRGRTKFCGRWRRRRRTRTCGRCSFASTVPAASWPEPRSWRTPSPRAPSPPGPMPTGRPRPRPSGWPAPRGASTPRPRPCSAAWASFPRSSPCPAISGGRASTCSCWPPESGKRQGIAPSRWTRIAAPICSSTWTPCTPFSGPTWRAISALSKARNGRTRKFFWPRPRCVWG